jgi:hypothetical protein
MAYVRRRFYEVFQKLHLILAAVLISAQRVEESLEGANSILVRRNLPSDSYRCLPVRMDSLPQHQAQEAPQPGNSTNNNL